MDIRKFKRAVTAILLGITALFVFNLFYLKGLADALHDEAARVVMACIESADSKELQLRLQKRRADPSVKHSAILIEKKKDNDSIVTMRNASIGEKRTTVVTVVPAESPYIELEQLAREVRTSIHQQLDASYPVYIELEQLAREVRTSIHQQLDASYPVDLQALDSLIDAELRVRGMALRVFRTEIVDERTGHVLQASFPHSMKRPTFKHVAVYSFNPERHYVYRVFLPSLTGVIVRQMAGILFSTLLLMVLLALSFRFLIRTVMQQRTLEEMKDDLTNNMTHELKTPIAAAYSAVDALLNYRQGEDPSKRAQYLQLCLDQLSHLSGLVEQILDMSLERRRKQELHREPVSIRALFERLTRLYSLRAGRPVHFLTEVAPPDLSLQADPELLSQAVGNLIDNAIKYSPGEPEITLWAGCEGAFYAVTVSDRGCGIPSASVGRIFDKFYRVPAGDRHDVKGYGLGLYHVRQIVERHGGRITVSPRPRGGSIFKIQIPK